MQSAYILLSLWEFSVSALYSRHTVVQSKSWVIRMCFCSCCSCQMWNSLRKPRHFWGASSFVTNAQCLIFYNVIFSRFKNWLEIKGNIVIPIVKFLSYFNPILQFHVWRISNLFPSLYSYQICSNMHIVKVC